MTTYQFVSVLEYTSGDKEGDRILKFGEADSSGADVTLGTPNNDQEKVMARHEWERLLTYRLPESMTKDEARDWLQENQPVPVWHMLGDEPDAEE